MINYNEEIFMKYGISNSDMINLKKVNLIIGENGSGKTRLLKAIKDSLSEMKDITTIYAYFSDVQATFSSKLIDSEYEKPLYEIIFEGGEIELSNFIIYIEHHGIKFLYELIRDIDRYSIYKKSVRRERAEKIYNDLNYLLEILINRRLKFGTSNIILESSIYKNEESLDTSLEKMSPGELSLFYLSILLIVIKYNKNEDKKLFLLLDEPELHLHPKVLIEFFMYLKNNLHFENCCIATHSIFLVPLVDFTEIIYINGGKIQPYNSELYNNIFNNIVGNNNKLSDFLISRDAWKYYEFIAECFRLPTVVDKVNIKDEQFLKFIEYIKDVENQKNIINVLDYGAGTGRLGKAFEKINIPENCNNRNVKYFYYDKYQEKPEELNCVAYKSINEIKENKKKFNCAVLMNVLHEIDVCEWENTFAEIYDILEEDGYLLIFEVITLSHGEQPYGNTGYILLGEQQIGILFKSNDIKTIDLKNTDKTNMFVISRNIIKNVCKNSIIKSLVSLNNELYGILKNEYEIRRDFAHGKEEPIQPNVKRYGFLSQHYLNSLFGLKIIGQINKSKVKFTFSESKHRGYFAIDHIMNELEKNNTNRLRVDSLRELLKEHTTYLDKNRVMLYLRYGNFLQRKNARYYCNYVKKN